MSVHRSDRNLLFGILALQMDFVSRDGLIKAMHAWALEKDKSLGAMLVADHGLEAKDCELLTQMVDRHIERHQGDVEQSLATVGSIESIRDKLESIPSPEFQEALTMVPAGATKIDESETTVSYVGVPSAKDHRFRVIRLHAEGGLGKVSLAMDEELNRQVALKEIKADYAHDENSQARFTMEAEITGGLEHPGIVPVYGLGKDEGGCPFYAMRFIKGDSLREAIGHFHSADSPVGSLEHSLELRRLLGRFIDVCHAIEYAHSRGVLHRDLKPGNIMLGKHGETLVVDWGLAKVVGRADPDEDSDESTLKPISGGDSAPTQLGMAIGTPAYMSPEQAEGKLDELGAATDIYSLGATLYFLLTNRAPYVDSNRDIIVGKVQRGKFDPPRNVNPNVPIALDAICRKAMSRKPSDRYESVNALAEEIERWLADEPVDAHVEPKLVRARRWLRKHPRTVTGLAAALMIGLTASIVIAGVVANSNRLLGIAYHEVSDAKDAESRARESAEENALQLATANRELDQRNKELELANRRIAEEQERVQQERDVAIALNSFIQDDLLGQASPEREPDRDIKLRQVLDRAVSSIGDRFQDQPLVEAEISSTIGNTYAALGEFDTSERIWLRIRELWTEAYGDDHVESLAANSNLAALYSMQGRYEEAESLFDATLADLMETVGDEHVETLACMNNLATLYQAIGRYDEAQAHFDHVLAVRERDLGPDHPETLLTWNNLAILLQARGDMSSAAMIFQEVYDKRVELLGDEHPATLTSAENLAIHLQAVGEWPKAHSMHMDIVETKTRVLGPDHPDTLIAKNNLARLQILQGRLGEARSMLREIIATKERILGETHASTLTSKNLLGSLLMNIGSYDQARVFMDAAFQGRLEQFGENHVSTIISMHNRGLLHQSEGEMEDAFRLLDRALSLSLDALTEHHPQTLECMTSLGNFFQANNDFENAAIHFERAFQIQQSVLGPEHPSTLTSLHSLALLEFRRGEVAAARQSFEEVIEIKSRVLGDDHPSTLSSRDALGTLLFNTGQLQEAESNQRAVYDIRRTVLGERHPETIKTQIGLAYLLYVTRRLAAAEELAVDALNQCRHQFSPDHPKFLECQNLAGVIFIDLQKYDAAEACLVPAYEGRRSRFGDKNHFTFEAATNLAQLYLMRRQFDKAELLLTETLANVRSVHGDNTPAELDMLNALGLLYAGQADLTKAAEQFESALEICRRNRGVRQVTFLRALKNLASIYSEANRTGDAIAIFSESLELHRRIYGPHHPKTLHVYLILARLHLSEDQRKEAATYFEILIDGHRNRLGEGELEFALTAAGIGRELVHHGYFDLAEKTLRESREVLLRSESNEWNLRIAESLLGAALTGRREFDEAEPLLLESYEAMRKLAAGDRIDAEMRLKLPVVNLISLYEAWERPDSAAKWRSELDKLEVEQKSVVKPEQDVRPPRPLLTR